MCYENRGAAYAAVCKERDELKRDNKRLNEAYEAMSRDLERMSNQLAEERLRGFWIDGESFGAKPRQFRVCSVCNICFPRDDRMVLPVYWQSCPNCRAKMEVKW